MSAIVGKILRFSISTHLCVCTNNCDSTMKTYNTLCKKIINLREYEKKLIAQLYLNYYEGSSEKKVLTDLENKSDIILMYNGDELVGFTSLQFYQTQWKNKLIHILYSGDTIVEKAHWGQQSLTFACIKRMGMYKNEQPEIPLYWFLIVKGHRTYKYLPTFVKSFYPHWNEYRSDLKAMADFLAYEKFADEYNLDTGIIEFSQPQGQLKLEYAIPSEAEKTKTAVNYFLQKNPNFTIGHELVCLCELTTNNLKPLTQRIFTNRV